LYLQILTGFAELAAKVEANEPGALSYQYFYNEAENEIEVFEMYIAPPTTFPILCDSD
jgi:quinol monooxygenase YgiN